VAIDRMIFSSLLKSTVDYYFLLIFDFFLLQSFFYVAFDLPHE